MRAKRWLALSAGILVMGCGGGGVQLETTRGQKDYESLIAVFPEQSPGFGRETYTQELVEEPMTVALVLRSEAIRFAATRHLEARRRAQFAADWLLAYADADGDGRPGWGTAGSWDAFSDGSVNPPSTVYTITTAIAIDALSAAASTPGLLNAETRELAAASAVASVRWALDRVWTDRGGSGFFAYSSAPTDDVDVPNVSAFMSGAIAAALVRFPSGFDADLRRRSEHAIDAAVAGLKAQNKTRDGLPYWPYLAKPNRFNNRDSWNDILHHAYIVYGLELVRRYRPGTDVGYERSSAIASFRSFWREDRVMDFPQNVAYEPGLESLPGLPGRSWGLGIAIAVACQLGDPQLGEALAARLKTDYHAFPSFSEYPAWFGSHTATFYPRYGAHALLGLAFLTYGDR